MMFRMNGDYYIQYHRDSHAQIYGYRCPPPQRLLDEDGWHGSLLYAEPLPPQFMPVLANRSNDSMLKEFVRTSSDLAMPADDGKAQTRKDPCVELLYILRTAVNDLSTISASPQIDPEKAVDYMYKPFCADTYGNYNTVEIHCVCCKSSCILQPNRVYLARNAMKSQHLPKVSSHIFIT